MHNYDLHTHVWQDYNLPFYITFDGAGVVSKPSMRFVKAGGSQDETLRYFTGELRVDANRVITGTVHDLEPGWWSIFVTAIVDGKERTEEVVLKVHESPPSSSSK